ncbi:TIGR02281 family clan AA aspartic protease [Phyllobacterium sp. OV277]|uniref:TIGR02281 family clan AA aspartic protease n=1 Tax=Phyllobacterium sp. OV277 TaxID=1882772 RepID=UPI0008858A22|nr:TIGR02281 family clan AA aspartic protease [Phyllobacterium sp. OV277]SDP87358.1 aspartyl protease family protein [Phyllobacterium sp. OV277]
MLKAEREDRNGGMPPEPSGIVGFVVKIILVCFVIVSALAAYIEKDRIQGYVDSFSAVPPDAAMLALYAQMDIQPLPAVVASRKPLATHLDTLRREPCDWDALYAFAGDLQTAGYKREAAKVLVAFSNKCQPSNVALNWAADILYGLSDLDGALKTSDELLKMSGDNAQFHFNRGQMLHSAHRYPEAINEYYSTIGLTDDQRSLNSIVFSRMAASYVALENYCEAITPLQSWIAINPSKNDTRQVQTMIEEYSSKGRCERAYATGSERLPTQGKDVILAKISVNGVSGTFIVDTGASFVSLTKEFAERAKLPLSNDYSVLMQTANGVSYAQRSTASQIKLGKVAANDVATVVLSESGKSLGNGVDGLLGRSFLSRFDVTFGANEWRVEAKK